MMAITKLLAILAILNQLCCIEPKGTCTIGEMHRWKLLVIFVLLAILAAGAEHKLATIQLLVVKDENGKPVRNAEVVLHPVGKDGKQKNDGYELKTHQDGRVSIVGIPYGKMRIQVIAHGLRTYGEDYEINQPVHEITIKLQKPAEQHSIYK
ncbi:MAG: hypothetical protein DMG65_12540 [Candidatus Angelobacter sp. Gp1-AA117]|nr:MAG: hypothetical protein DMG65_12540 [Candidatus Angelobacter sp. Gp1-AA117]